MKSILVVDDEAIVRKSMKRQLEAAGYLVLECANGKDALSLMNVAKLDLVITDLVMPDMDGVELIRKLRAARPELKLVAISGAFESKFLPAARMLGARATLAKPFSPKELLNTVAEILPAAPAL